MALTTRSPGASPIDSSAVNQYYQALTGAMTDQAFTLANTLTVSKTLTGSSAGAITNTLTCSSQVTVQGTFQQGSGAALTAISSANGGLFMGPLTSVRQNTSSTVKAFAMGSSGPGIFFGSSIPAGISGVVPGSLFLNAGGSSVQLLYVWCGSSGSTSSSGWTPVTLS